MRNTAIACLQWLRGEDDGGRVEVVVVHPHPSPAYLRLQTMSVTMMFLGGYDVWGFRVFRFVRIFKVYVFLGFGFCLDLGSLLFRVSTVWLFLGFRVLWI